MPPQPFSPFGGPFSDRLALAAISARPVIDRLRSIGAITIAPPATRSALNGNIDKAGGLPRGTVVALARQYLDLPSEQRLPGLVDKWAEERRISAKTLRLAIRVEHHRRAAAQGKAA